MSLASLEEAAAVHPPRETTAQKGTWRALSCIRYWEVLLLQGTPFVGIFFAVSSWSVSCVIPVALFSVASAALVAHIWSFNDWADFHGDRLASSKTTMAAFRRGIEPLAILKVSLALLFVSMGLFALLPWPTFTLALAISFFGFLYSFPATGWKGMPLLSSASHLVGGLLHFLLGYSLFSAIDRRAFLIAPFFALIFMAGHVTQEVQDYNADRLGGIRTNAVVFGKKTVFLAGLAVFTAAYGYLFVLALAGVVSLALGWLALGLFLPHFFWTFQALRGGLTEEGVCRLRRNYRILIALFGLAMVLHQIL